MIKETNLYGLLEIFGLTNKEKLELARGIISNVALNMNSDQLDSIAHSVKRFIESRK